jgi:hypothetical protein
MQNIKMNLEEWFDQAIEITIDSDDKFLIIKETLERIGIPSYKDGIKKLSQTCHIYQKRKKLFIVHFKEMLLIDGKEVNFSDEDKMRRNTIANMLKEWGFISFVKEEEMPRLPTSSVKVIPHKDRHLWKLVPKYNIGNK